MSDEDIVDLLREHANDEGMLGNDLLARCLWDAANEIERLRARILLREPRRIKEHDERIP